MKKEKKMNTYPFLQANLNKIKDREELIKACMKACNVTRKHVARALFILSQGSTIKTSANSGIAVDDFIQRYDYVKILEDSIKKHLSSKNSKVYTDLEFRTISKIPLGKWRVITFEEKYGCYRTKIQGKGFWTSKQNIDRIKKLDI